MTPEDLEELILGNRASSELPEIFSGFDDAERKKLSKAARSLYSQITRLEANKDASDRLKAFIRKRPKRWDETDQRVREKATLALLALCPLSTLKREHVFLSWEENDLFARIMLDRRPDWLGDWVTHELAKEFSGLRIWTIRRWIKEGACEKPRSDDYFAKLVVELQINDDEKPGPSLSEKLLAEPDLLEDVWGLFRVETGAFTYGWGVQDGKRESWSDALIKLSESGHLDRQRLLEASLEGLSQDLKQNQLSGFHKFHKLLAPTKEELSARQAEYLALLSHKVGHVCKFALEMLTQLEKVGDLDAPTFLAEVQAVFFQEAKGNAVSALKLIQRAIKKHPDLLQPALQAVAEALQNANPDVQEDAIAILESYSDALGEDLQAAIHRASDFVSVSIRNRLAGLTGQEGGPAIVPGGEPDVSGSPADAEEIEAALAALSPGRSQALGIGEILAQVSFTYRPVSENILDHEILPTVEPLERVQSVEELIALVSHAVEQVDTPDEIERIIEGISRLGTDRSGDFDAKVAPLLHRLNQGGSGGSNGITGYGGLNFALADLILTWLTGKLHETPTEDYTEPEYCFEPVIGHLRKITQMIAEGKSAPLLSAPTHSGGWIEPLAWVGRLQDAGEKGQDLDRRDFCRSVVRLMPENRPAALQAMQGLSGEFGRPAAFALGGEARLSLSDRPDYDLWICAARARDPGADWSDFLAPLKLLDPWPDSSMPARYAWQARSEEHKYTDGQVYKIPKLDIQISTDAAPESGGGESGGMIRKLGDAIAAQAKTKWRRLPPAALNRLKERKYFWSGDLTTTWASQWLTHQWPLRPHGAYVTGVRALMDRIDDDSSNWSPGFGYFHGLFQKNRPWLAPGHLLLCLGLAGKDADSRGLAVDAMIEGIEAGQLDPKLFAGTLEDLAQGGWLKLNRLGETLMQVLQASPLHAWVVSEALQHWLATTDLKQRNMFCVLEALLEAQALAGRPLDEALRQALANLKGGSKAAKLAKKILEVSDRTPSASQTAKHLAIASRLKAA